MTTTWKTAATAFIAGLALGTFLGGAAAAYHRRHDDPQKRHARMLEHFSRRLKLDARQKDQVSGILDSSHARIEALRAEFHPRFEDIRNSTETEIRLLLRPEQQASFDRMRERWNRNPRGCDRP